MPSHFTTGCDDCYSANPQYFTIPAFLSSTCNDCGQENCLPVKNICYTGPDLTCSGIITGDTLEDALQKLDIQVCSAIGDYTTYQFNCLEAWWEEAITTESEFVDAITAYSCEIAETLVAFTGVDFPAYQAEVTAQFEEVTGPGITCTTAGVTNVDSLTTILSKYCTKFSAIEDMLDISAVDWQQCYTVIPAPETIAEGFDTLISQICGIQTLAEAAAVLPTFNNTASCLDTPGLTDTLVDTIEKIKTRLCATEEFVPEDITADCFEEAETLQNVVQNIVTQVSDNQKLLITAVSADFVLSPTDGLDACDGLTLELAVPIVNNDRLVASNVADTSPGTLVEKLTAGDNITLDDTTTPGQIIITATNDNLILATNTDVTPGYLEDKLAGDSVSGITITPTPNGGGTVIDLLLGVDTNVLGAILLDAFTNNPTLRVTFCQLVADCVANDCGSISYTITNISGDPVEVSWTECNNPYAVSVVVANGAELVVCAIPDSVVAPGCTIVAGDSCNPEITSTTTTTTSTTTTTTTTTAAP